VSLFTRMNQRIAYGQEFFRGAVARVSDAREGNISWMLTDELAAGSDPITVLRGMRGIGRMRVPLERAPQGPLPGSDKSWRSLSSSPSTLECMEEDPERWDGLS
jgi:hypothetical protein